MKTRGGHLGHPFIDFIRWAQKVAHNTVLLESNEGKLKNVGCTDILIYLTPIDLGKNINVLFVCIKPSGWNIVSFFEAYYFFTDC